MTRMTAAVILLVVCMLGFASGQAAETRPDWRTVRTSTAFLWKYWQKDAKRYEVPALALVQQFAESAKVAVRFDEPSLVRVAPVSLVLGEGAEPPALFDLCQMALAPRYTLLPEGGDRRFTVCLISDVGSRAPRVAPEELEALAAHEWAVLVAELGGRDARAVERALQPLRGMSGKLEITNDGRSLMIIDIGTNLRRMHGLIPSLDRVREVVPLVPYQRASKADLSRLVISLRALNLLFCRNSGIPEDKVIVNWDSETGVLSGMIPRPLAGTIDAAMEAAESRHTQREAADAAEPGRFVQFSISAPAGMEVVQFSVRLRMLFDTEANGGHARFVPKDDKTPTLFVRCRPWLEAEIREAAALMSN
ncbi:MAG: hypothetical protein KF754_05445 [Planctomycetes bacterium]|nr:hypothetical protein [Planctomycetota bacterium]